MVRMREIKAVGGSRKVWNSGWPNRKPGVRRAINRNIERRFRHTQQAAVDEGLQDELDELSVDVVVVIDNCVCDACFAEELDADASFLALMALFAQVA